VIVIDANLLIYAYDLASADHKKSLVWLENVLSGTEAVGLPWQSISAFPSDYESAFGGSACSVGASCGHCRRVATTAKCANPCARGSALARVETNDLRGTRLRATGK